MNNKKAKQLCERLHPLYFMARFNATENTQQLHRDTHILNKALKVAERKGMRGFVECVVNKLIDDEKYPHDFKIVKDDDVAYVAKESEDYYWTLRISDRRVLLFHAMLDITEGRRFLW